MAGMADSDNPVTGPDDFCTNNGELQVGYKFFKSVGDKKTLNGGVRDC